MGKKDQRNKSEQTTNGKHRKSKYMRCSLCSMYVTSKRKTNSSKHNEHRRKTVANIEVYNIR